MNVAQNPNAGIGQNYGHKSQDNVNSGKATPLVLIFNGVAQHEIGHVGQPHNDNQRQPGAPDPPGIPGRFGPHRTTDDGDGGENDPNFHGGQGYCVPIAGRPSQIANPGIQSSQEGDQGHPGRPHMEIENTLYLTHVPLIRRIKEDHEQADDHQPHSQPVQNRGNTVKSCGHLVSFGRLVMWSFSRLVV